MINYEILAKTRRKKGITWTYLENAIGAYRGKFVEYSHGKTTLTDKEELEVAKILNVSLDYLCGESEQKEKPLTERERLIEDSLSLMESLPEDLQKVAHEQLKALSKIADKNKKK